MIDEETYWKAKAAAAGRLQSQGRPTRRFNNLLHGLARCPTCDSAMSYIDKGKKGRPRLQCASAISKSGCSNRQFVLYSGIDLLLVHAYAHFADAAMFALAEGAREAAEQIEALARESDDAIARRTRLIELAEGGKPLPEIRARLDELVLQSDRLERKIKELRAVATREADAADNIEDRMDIVFNLINATDPEERARERAKVNARLRILLEKIVVFEGARLQFHFNPEYHNIDQRVVSEYYNRR